MPPTSPLVLPVNVTSVATPLLMLVGLSVIAEADVAATTVMTTFDCSTESLPPAAR